MSTPDPVPGATPPAAPPAAPPPPPSAPPPPAPPAPDAFINSVPQEYREAVTKAGLADLGALAKNWHDAQASIGSMIRIPGPDAGADDLAKFEAKLAERVPHLVTLPKEGDPESRKRYNARLGVPETPAGYKFPVIEGVPEQAAKQLDEWFAPIAHGADLPPEQAAKVRAAWFESLKASSAAAATAEQATIDALKQEWGATYEERLANGKAFLHQFVPAAERDALDAELDRTGWGNSPILAKAFEKASRLLGEDVALPGGRPTSLTASELRTQIAEVQNNKQHPYHHAAMPGHKEAVDAMAKRFERLDLLQNAAA